jgi:hypothetical protein
MVQGKTRRQLCLPLGVLLLGGCVDLTPPWNGVVADAAQGGAVVGGATEPSTGNGGAGGVDAPASARGGAGGTSRGLDGPAAGGATSSIDSPLLGPEVSGEVGGAGGQVLDADIDVPLGGAGGVGRDGPLDWAGAGGAGAGGAGRGGSADGGRNTGGGGAGGGGADGRGTGGSGSGGSGAGGRGTGGSGTGGSGTGGNGTGGNGTGGSGTGGSGTGGAGVVMSGLVAYYPCDQATGSTLPDLSGNSHNATLVTGTGGTAGYSFGTGPKTGLKNALHLVKSSQGYVSIPAGLLSSASAMTIATWVYLNSSADWQRVWDFGTSTTSYMFFTPRISVSPNYLRFAITRAGNDAGAEQQLNGTAELSIGEWHHVAVVIGSSGGILYVDGAQLTTNPGMTLKPSDLGSTTNNYIGKSQYSDPYLDGSIDDFRVYDRALSAAEIQTLYNWTGS